jgi:hypothetical protein
MERPADDGECCVGEIDGDWLGEKDCESRDSGSAEMSRTFGDGGEAERRAGSLAGCWVLSLTLTCVAFILLAVFSPLSACSRPVMSEVLVVISMRGTDTPPRVDVDWLAEDGELLPRLFSSLLIKPRERFGFGFGFGFGFTVAFGVEWVSAFAVRFGLGIALALVLVVRRVPPLPCAFSWSLYFRMHVLCATPCTTVDVAFCMLPVACGLW